eukprot:761618-Hanusia_phi.AAC.3
MSQVVTGSTPGESHAGPLPSSRLSPGPSPSSDWARPARGPRLAPGHWPRESPRPAASDSLVSVRPCRRTVQSVSWHSGTLRLEEQYGLPIETRLGLWLHRTVRSFIRARH